MQFLYRLRLHSNLVELNSGTGPAQAITCEKDDYPDSYCILNRYVATTTSPERTISTMLDPHTKVRKLLTEDTCVIDVRRLLLEPGA